ncbi:hypothetical protein [Prescottella subtropica]|uniref:hypothetical protein n=1 Tax=Prescottella subtropica TaxID=2545757 RepID=UPI0010F74395|nr:hypothetical protein [Prescottella subtropica]
MVNERLFDDDTFLKAGETMPAPHSTGVLLGRLRLLPTDDATRRAGIRAWLAVNEPSPALVRSLRRRGYGDLIDEPGG